MKNTKLRDFLWYCSTAHKALLEQCPTDHHKHALIGTLVLLTALFAFISGGFAMYYAFELNNNAVVYAVLFGLLWGFLIFSIDRLLISTIRKDTGIKVKKNSPTKQAVLIGLRFGLAIVISIVITKPLELWLYQDQINAQIVDNVKDRNEEDEQTIDEDLGINQLSERKNAASSRINLFNEEIENVENDSVFQRLRTEYQDCEKEFNNFKWKKNKEKRDKQYKISRIEGLKESKYVEQGRRYNNPDDPTDYTTIALLSDAGKAEIGKLKRQINGIKYEIKSKENNCAYIAKKAEKRKAYLLDTLSQQLALAETDKSTAEQKLNNNLQKRGVVLDSLKYINNAADRGIFGRIDVLHQYSQATPSRRIASWLLFIIFLIIETAPIIAKMVSKAGPYDYKLAAMEFQAQQHEEQRKKLIEQALKTQAEVAAKALEMWKKEQIQLAEDDPYSFVKEIEQRKKEDG